ncbi:MAG: SpoIID/LytB domain-containing protein [Nitrospirae bacterium]|nr:SpoIID/LytB domain-containing protein [Nitrospirota bacterium]
MCSPSSAEVVATRSHDTIKVLIIDAPEHPTFSGKAEKLGSIRGEVFVNGNRYKGSIEVKRSDNGLIVINELPLETYVEGVVASEVGRDWEMEALKAQAVISRTYAVYHRAMNAGRDYHLTSTVLHQVYKGENYNPMISQAVRETEGEILTFESRPIEAIYHSTCGGKTELPEEVWENSKAYPYLRQVGCSDESSPYSTWQRRFNFNDIGKALGIKDIKDIKIVSLTSTGRVKMLKVFTENSEQMVKATDLRRLLGYKELPSTMFTMKIEGREILLEGGGYGHGVGLCQWGSLELAKKGKNYKEILRYYYPGTVISKLLSN